MEGKGDDDTEYIRFFLNWNQVSHSGHRQQRAMLDGPPFVLVSSLEVNADNIRRTVLWLAYIACWWCRGLNYNPFSWLTVCSVRIHKSLDLENIKSLIRVAFVVVDSQIFHTHANKRQKMALPIWNQLQGVGKTLSIILHYSQHSCYDSSVVLLLSSKL